METEIQKDDAVISNFLKKIDEGFPYYYGKETNRYGDLLQTVDSGQSFLSFLEKIAEEEDPLGNTYKNTIYSHVDRLWEKDPNLAAGLMVSVTRLFLRHDSIFFTAGYIFGQNLQVTEPNAIQEIRLLKRRMRRLIPRLAQRRDFRHLSEKDAGKMDYKQRFLDFCRHNRGLSQNTIRSYEWDLRQFFAWLNQNEIKLLSVTVKHIDSFLIWLREKGGSVSTVNRHMYCLKTFYKWLLRMELIQRNPLQAFENIRGSKRLPKYLTPEQQQVLLGATKISQHKKKPWLTQSGRDYLLILLLMDTGMRIAEACNLKIGDINLGTGILRVIGKGDKQREIVISDRLGVALDKYLKVVQKKENPGGYLLFSKTGQKMVTRVVYRLVMDLGKKAGIPDLHPHALRHTFGSNLRRWGADLLLIKEALGHSSVSTTEIYSHLGAEDQQRKVKDLVDRGKGEEDENLQA
jgi:site-specific recombinase XerD